MSYRTIEHQLQKQVRYVKVSYPVERYPRPDKDWQCYVHQDDPIPSEEKNRSDKACKVFRDEVWECSNHPGNWLPFWYEGPGCPINGCDCVNPFLLEAKDAK